MKQRKATYEELEKRIEQINKSIEQRLQDSENRYLKIVENCPDAVSIHTEGKIVYINKACICLLGATSASEIIGKSIFEFVHPDYRALIIERIEKQKEENCVMPWAEEKLLRLDGTSIDVETIAIPAKYDSKTASQLIIRDISERKKIELTLKKSEARYRAIADFSYDWETFRDNFGNLIYSSPAFERITGYLNEDYISGKITLKDFIHPDDYAFSMQEFNKTNEGKNIPIFEFRLLAKSGEIKYMNVSVQHAFIGEGVYIGFRSSIKDITEIKIAEQKLQQQKKQLEELNSTKDKLISIIAHDLRNPISSIIGLSGLLINNFREYDIELTETFLKNINVAAKRNSDILQNLLTWANNQTGAINFNPKKTDLLKNIKEIIEILSPSAILKNISINVEPTEKTIVYADQNMLQTILRNLISNGIKYTKQGGYVNISAKSFDQYIKIAVTDNGVGIDEKIKQNLFKVGEPVTCAGTEGESGTGLGLIICKEFVEKHGGEICVESEPNKGSEFKFTIPVIK